MASAEIVRQKLIESIQKCNFRGLHCSSTWAGEQLEGMTNENELQESISEIDDSVDESFSLSVESCSKSEQSHLLLASSLLSNGEYQRCAYMLKKKGARRGNTNSNAGLFLLYYSQYMAGEKLKDQLYSESTKIQANPTGPVKQADDHPTDEKVINPNNNLKLLKNRYLVEIYNALAPLYLEDKCDAFLIYLLGVVVRDLYRTEGVPLDQVRESFDEWKHTDTPEKQRKKGDPRLPLNPRSLFIHSISLYPWNWSCWLELSALCISDSLPVPEWSEVTGRKVQLGLLDHHQEERLVYLCFLAHYYLDNHRGDLAMQALELVLPMFPTSLALHCQIGLAHYAWRDYDRAQECFELIREQDPYRLNSIDTYSNILYVKEKRTELSLLAHSIVKIDKYAPESCCVVGNYYSLKGQHERAITYFQRALALNSQYLSAWTLMGHEYMELRNTTTAVSCYRQALNISEADYRAWYGLGQTYEMLHLYQYASYYYKKAATLRPVDARMWSAVGNCMLKLNLKEEAIATFERAVQCGDSEGISTRELARLCRSEGQTKRAAEFYFKYLQTTPVLEMRDAGSTGGSADSIDAVLGGQFSDANPSVDSDQAEALLFLATYYRKMKNFELAELFCSRLLNTVGAEGDEARAMSKELRFGSDLPTTTTTTSAAAAPRRPTTASRSARLMTSGLDGSLLYATDDAAAAPSGGASTASGTSSGAMEEEEVEGEEVQYYPDLSISRYSASRGGAGGDVSEASRHYHDLSGFSEESSELPPLNMTQALSYVEEQSYHNASSFDLNRSNNSSEGDDLQHQVLEDSTEEGGSGAMMTDSPYGNNSRR